MKKTIFLFFLFALSLLNLEKAKSGDYQLACGVALDGYPIDEVRLEKVKKNTGMKPSFVVFFLQWPNSPESGFFPESTLLAIKNIRAIPVITWEPMYIDHDHKELAIPAKDILIGKYDFYINEFAESCKKWSDTLIIRFAHEMNIKRYHWGTDEEEYGPKSPDIYKQVYRYVVDIFKKKKAFNVLWAFCPNAESLPHPKWHGAKWNKAIAYFPGIDYVDILGMDGYNWGLTRNTKQHGWQSKWLEFNQIFEDLYRELSSLDIKKPIIVFETSCAQQGGSREKWVSSAMLQCQKWDLRGLIWFQVNKEIDWRLIMTRDAESLQTIKTYTSGVNINGILETKSTQK